MEVRENGFQNPSKKRLIFTILLSALSIALCFAAMSNLFTESIFQSSYSMMWILIVLNVVMCGRLYYNYTKNVKK